MLRAGRDVVDVWQRFDGGRIEAVGSRGDERAGGTSAGRVLVLQTVCGSLAQRQVWFGSWEVAGRLDVGRVRSVHGLGEGLGDGWTAATAAAATTTLVLWACVRLLLQHAWRRSSLVVGRVGDLLLLQGLQI